MSSSLQDLMKWGRLSLLLIAFIIANSFQMYSQCTPLLPSANPIYNLGGRTISVTNLTIDGVPLFKVVAPGANFNVNFNWSIGPTLTACPGCVTFFNFGLSNVNVPGSPGGATTYPNTFCMGNISAGQNSTSSGTFTAPVADGYYYITLSWQWVFWCHQFAVNHCNNAIIGLIKVGNPELLSAELDTLTHLTACESNDGSIAINVFNPIGCFSTNWSGPNGYSASGPISISGLSPGNYQVVVSDIAGCDTTLNFTINDFLQESIDLGNDTVICQGESLILQADFIGATYLWQDGSTGNSLTVTQPGIYWVEVTSGNCIQVDSIQIDYTAIAVDLGADTSICNNSLLLDATTIGANYLWQNGTTNPTLLANTSSTYWVDVSIGNCVERDSIVVTIDNLFSVNLGSDSSICGSNTILNATTSNATYLWQDGSTNPTFTATNDGLYLVDVTVGSCVVRDSIILDFALPFSIDLGNDTSLCQGNLLLDATISGGSYVWQDGSGNPTFTANSSGAYFVTVANGSICPAQSDTILVDYPEPIQFVGIEDTTICNGANFVAVVEADGFDILWSDGSNSVTNNFIEEGIYWVDLNNNCEIFRDTFIISSIVCGCPFSAPSAFTPNNDDFNDNFLVYIPCGALNFEIHIYNRWGYEVFSSNNSFIGWNGTHNGQELEMDNYAWVVKYTPLINGVEGDEILETGMVLLMK
jgi:gliding motility-associated-like protein